jgi:methionine biosynthesis protein MetW
MRSAREFYETDVVRRIHYDGTDPVVARRNAMVLDLLPQGGRCLDVGCGAGAFGPLLGRKFRQVAGVDLALPLLAAAGGRGEQPVAGDLDEGALPFVEGTFDAVVCCDVMEHVFDPVAFASRLVRVMRPGATLVVSVPNIRYWPRVASLLFGGYFPRTTGDPHGYDGGHLHYFAPANLREVLEAAGLRDVTSYGFNADLSRRARPVDWALRTPGLRRPAREFGCSTIIARGSRPAPDGQPS